MPSPGRCKSVHIVQTGASDVVLWMGRFSPAATCVAGTAGDFMLSLGGQRRVVPGQFFAFRCFYFSLSCEFDEIVLCKRQFFWYTIYDRRRTARLPPVFSEKNRLFRQRALCSVH